MKNLLNKFIALVFIAAASSAAYPQKVCSVDAWIEDKDPKGLNVRKTGSPAGEIITRLVKGEDEITLNILASNGAGWMKITNADNNESIIFSGMGWVSAAMLATGTKGWPNYNSPAKLYMKPSTKSKKVTTIPTEDMVKMVDCDGEWAKVSYKGKTGWLAPENQCPSPYTTCN